jgi:hypothetical protein
MLRSVEHQVSSPPSRNPHVVTARGRREPADERPPKRRTEVDGVLDQSSL